MELRVQVGNMILNCLWYSNTAHEDTPLRVVFFRGFQIQVV